MNDPVTMHTGALGFVISGIVLRRRRAIVRIREEEERYSASPGRAEDAPATGS